MRPSVPGRDWLPVIFGFALGFAGVWEGRALELRGHFISAAAGSGAEECLAGGRECGSLAADARCKADGQGVAHGQGVAVKFGRPADDSKADSDSIRPASEQRLCRLRRLIRADSEASPGARPVSG